LATAARRWRRVDQRQRAGGQAWIAAAQDLNGEVGEVEGGVHVLIEC
jgi:hypothetical protein